MNINLFSLLAVTQEQMLRRGGVYIETLNEHEDGTLYIPVSISELVDQTLSNQQPGEEQ